MFGVSLAPPGSGAASGGNGTRGLGPRGPSWPATTTLAIVITRIAGGWFSPVVIPIIVVLGVICAILLVIFRTSSRMSSIPSLIPAFAPVSGSALVVVVSASTRCGTVVSLVVILFALVPTKETVIFVMKGKKSSRITQGAMLLAQS